MTDGPPDVPPASGSEFSTVVLAVVSWLGAVGCFAWAGYIVVANDFELNRNLNPDYARYFVPVYLASGFFCAIGALLVRGGFWALEGIRERRVERDQST